MNAQHPPGQRRRLRRAGDQNTSEEQERDQHERTGSAPDALLRLRLGRDLIRDHGDLG
jgi:hypothetical protein